MAQSTKQTHYWSQLARQITPYVAGEQLRGQQVIKLNTNESPYPPSSTVGPAVAQATAFLRLYPDGGSASLCSQMAALHGLETTQVFMGNGSDEVLAFAFLALFAGKTLCAPDITYSFYPVYAKLFGVNYQSVPLHDDFSVHTSALMAGKPIIFANPNAPTSRALALDEVEKLVDHCHRHGQPIIVDEAYIAFGGQSALPLLARYDNLLIIGTLSKAYALAGLRVGYALGHPALIAALQCIRDSFNSYPLDSLAQAGALAALKDQAYYTEITQKTIDTRNQTAQKLTSLGFIVQPSATNFLFVTHPKVDAQALQQGLRAQNILVRRFSAPRIENYLRISMGTDAQMQTVCQALQTLLA